MPLAETAELTIPNLKAIRESSAEPSRFEVVLVVLASAMIFVIVVSLLTSYSFLAQHSADNATYIATSSAIRHWDFRGVAVRQFWGLPYVMSGVSLLPGVSASTALLLV